VGRLGADLQGRNILGHWRHVNGPGSDFDLRMYYDRTERDDESFTDTLDTGDIDFQYRLELPWSQELTWGAEYRYTSNENRENSIFVLDPEKSDDDVISAFLQDQITFFDSLRLTLGSKFEHNDFSGFEWQPSVRAAQELPRRQSVWAAISRAARVPTRFERDIAIDLEDPSHDPIFRLLGNEDFDSEELLAYEVGYRVQALDSLSLDVATFYNDYDRLATLELADETFVDSQGKTVIPVVAQNQMDGHSTGVETQVNYTPFSTWRITGSFTYLDTELNPEGMDLNGARFFEGSTPHKQFGLRSMLDLPGGLQLDMMFRNVGDLTSIPASAEGSRVDGYSELDVRLAWQIDRHWQLSVVGQNLLHAHHAEFGDPARLGEIQRGVYGRIVARY
jgi:iron complex outermembrane receptor protein